MIVTGILKRHMNYSINNIDDPDWYSYLLACLQFHIPIAVSLASPVAVSQTHSVVKVSWSVQRVVSFAQDLAKLRWYETRMLSIPLRKVLACSFVQVPSALVWQMVTHFWLGERKASKLPTGSVLTLRHLIPSRWAFPHTSTLLTHLQRLEA